MLRKFYLVALTLLLSTAAMAAHPPQISLWPNGAPGSEGVTAKEIDEPPGAQHGYYKITNVHLKEPSPSTAPSRPGGCQACRRQRRNRARFIRPVRGAVAGAGSHSIAVSYSSREPAVGEVRHVGRDRRHPCPITDSRPAPDGEGGLVTAT